LRIIILISDNWRLIAGRFMSWQNWRLFSYRNWIHDEVACYLLGAGSIDFNGWSSLIFWWWREASLWLLGVKWI